ncbi:hypothetical protein [Oceaniovalibus sp. ACAM 378]|uniref:hypothetical protein n=1 Tax=Oceaniovalibus sp. ACAM 378 TaxID=2599923 RepID=UPI0011D7DA64|nr:hypothetical protein [Oceaniovalibus sp. ACAM 378]TYB85189.1 hypothetical protein FQ320_19790 [Oceaniovalibus sp. ACAM 378]
MKGVIGLARQLGLKTGLPLSKVVEVTQMRRKIGGAEGLCPPRDGIGHAGCMIGKGPQPDRSSLVVEWA